MQVAYIFGLLAMVLFSIFVAPRAQSLIRSIIGFVTAPARRIVGHARAPDHIPRAIVLVSIVASVAAQSVFRADRQEIRRVKLTTITTLMLSLLLVVTATFVVPFASWTGLVITGGIVTVLLVHVLEQARSSLMRAVSRLHLAEGPPRHAKRTADITDELCVTIPGLRPVLAMRGVMEHGLGNAHPVALPTA